MTLSDGLWRIATISCLNVRNALYVWTVVIDGVFRQFYFSREHLYLSISGEGRNNAVYKELQKYNCGVFQSFELNKLGPWYRIRNYFVYVIIFGYDDGRVDALKI